MKVLYLDEAGDHSLALGDPGHPVFVLGGVIVDRAYARDVMEPLVRAFKQTWFGTEEIILHTSDIARARNGFERLREDGAFRLACLAALSRLMQELDYQVVACVVYKRRYAERFGNHPVDLYGVSLEDILKCFCDVLGDTLDSGAILAERRRPDLDHELELAWERMRTGRGSWPTDQGLGALIDNRVTGLSLKAKSLNIAGLQLADLVISPVARHHIGKHTHGNWEVVKSKLCADSTGNTKGYGLIEHPSPT